MPSLSLSTSIVSTRGGGGGGGFVMPPDLVAAFTADDLSGLANGASVTSLTDSLAGSSWVNFNTAPTKETFRGLPVLHTAAGSGFRCASVFDSSFDTALTVVYISLADTAGSNQTAVSNGGIFSGLALAEQNSGTFGRFNQWFGKTSPTGTQYGAGQVVTYRYDGADITLNRNGDKDTAANTGNLGLSGDLDLGAASFGFSGNFRLVLIFNRVLTDNEVDSIVAHFGPLSQGFTGNDVIMCIGDSQTGTTGGSGSVTYPDVMKSELDTAVYQYNYIWTQATSGWTLSQMQTAISTDVRCQTPNTAEREIAVIWGGTNDVTSGATGAQCIAALDALIAECEGRGFTHFVLCTCLTITADTAPFIAARNAFNAHIASLASATVAVVSLHTQPELDDPTDTTYFNADGIHLNDAGKTVVGELVALAIQNW